MSDAIVLRAVASIEEVEHFQELERLIWQSPPEDVVPVHVAITVIRNGGGLIAAFDAAGPVETGGMVGLTFWFPGLGIPTTGETGREGGRETRRRGNKSNRPIAQSPNLQSPISNLPIPSSAPRPSPLLKMCSHMAGVLPAWQGRGLGVRLKLAQRDAILAQGVTDWVTWTYDPLFRVNAVLNIHRLGAVCNTYKRNWYGVMKDGLNAGAPSDRCQVDWWLASVRVKERIVRSEGRRELVSELPDDLQVLPTVASGETFRAPVDVEPILDGRPIAVPIPDDIVAIRRADAGLGMAWRLSMRHALEQAFAAGYVMTDCLHVANVGWHYLLERLSAISEEHP
jgi:predicted GNAT superfamily acetyltransferase